jgi:hypothetical protein
LKNYDANLNQFRGMLQNFFYPWDFRDRRPTPRPMQVLTRLTAHSLACLPDLHWQIWLLTFLTHFSSFFTFPPFSSYLFPSLFSFSFLFFYLFSSLLFSSFSFSFFSFSVNTQGSFRYFDKFDLKLEARDEINVLLPFIANKLSTSTSSKPPGFVSLRSSAATLKYTMPMRVTDSGYTSVYELSLSHLTGTTSLPFPSLLDSCDSFTLHGSMHYPLAWNGMSTWTYNMELLRPVIQHVKVQIPFFMAILPSLAYTPHKYSEANFTPIIYKVSIKTIDFQLLWMCNQYNVFDTVDEHSSEDMAKQPHKRQWKNAALNFRGAHADVDFDIYYPEFTMPLRKTRYLVQCRDLFTALVLPAHHSYSMMRDLHKARPNKKIRKKNK